VEDYIDCLIREMDYVSKRMSRQILDSVYIGGGTPTTLEAKQLDRLITALKERFDFSTVKEFTVEAGRADSITREKLEVLYKHGVSRISVNPQTMKQETLDIIGRRATVEQVKTAYKLAREVGFNNINMDLILGLPGEMEEDVQNTINQVVQLSPDSLTVHSLAIKRASHLSQWIQENGVETLRNTDATMAIARQGAESLGMKPYYLYRQKNMSGNFENVGYAKPGKYGLYNILIMEELQTIIALGAGSITKAVWPDGRIERCDNVKDVRLYIDKIDEMIQRKETLLTECYGGQSYAAE
jgi:oxygen-independent coproporphyrinogen-3 oxidase